MKWTRRNIERMAEREIDREPRPVPPPSGMLYKADGDVHPRTVEANYLEVMRERESKFEHLKMRETPELFYFVIVCLVPLAAAALLIVLVAAYFGSV